MIRILGSIIATIDHLLVHSDYTYELPITDWIWGFLKDHGLKDDWICLFCEGKRRLHSPVRD